jgi:PII-like signaling protein
MNTTQVLVARIYTREVESIVKPILEYLKKEAKVRGVSIFRAVTGYGDNGDVHTSFLIDLSLDLPIAIEFFDRPEVINPALDYLAKIVKPEHILCWEAKVNI